MGDGKSAVSTASGSAHIADTINIKPIDVVAKFMFVTISESVAKQISLFLVMIKALQEVMSHGLLSSSSASQLVHTLPKTQSSYCEPKNVFAQFNWPSEALNMTSMTVRVDYNLSVWLPHNS